MAGTLYFVDKDNRLSEMQPAPFETEADFQRLLADHPPLLSLAAGTNGNLLLVSQEYGIGDDDGASARWSIDHLFLTRDGVPVLVEVKRSSDTRGRREVVAQMLDYASHGSANWSGTEIAARFQQTAERMGRDPEIELKSVIGEEDGEAFWRRVEANLRSGRIRMVFVSDKIGKELRRIVEWLNEQLHSAEVLAIEVAHFIGPDGSRTLLPQLVGDTERAVAAKVVAPRAASITASAWLAGLTETLSPDLASVATKIAGWLESLGLEPRVTSANKSLAFDFADGRTAFCLYASPAVLEFYLRPLSDITAFADELARRKILEQIQVAVPGFQPTQAGPNSYPRVRLAALAEPATWDRYRSLMQEIVSRIRE